VKHYKKAHYFIAGHRRGWVFSSSDLLSIFTRREADDNLNYIAKLGKI
jgi:hypothetical protein